MKTVVTVLKVSLAALAASPGLLLRVLGVSKRTTGGAIWLIWGFVTVLAEWPLWVLWAAVALSAVYMAVNLTRRQYKEIFDEDEENEEG